MSIMEEEEERSLLTLHGGTFSRPTVITRLWIWGFGRGGEACMLFCSIRSFSGSPFCIQLRHSTCDGIGVIATLGSLSPALETPWGRCDVVAGSATLGQRQRCPRMPVLGELFLTSSSLYDKR